jgi:hypothetical protein
MNRGASAMKSFLIRLVFVPLFGFLTGGCAHTESVSTYILNTTVEGPVAQIPVHITTDGTPNSITITPSASLRVTDGVRGNVDGAPPLQALSLYPPETTVGLGGSTTVRRNPPQYTMAWNLPDYSLGLDLDFTWKSFAFAVGGSYTALGGNSLTGWYGSVGTFAVANANLGFRLDAGISWQAISHTTASVVLTTTELSFLGNVISKTADTTYYLDKQRETKLGYFLSLTLNSVKAEWPVNFFVQLAFNRQTLFDFEPRKVTTMHFPIPIVEHSSGGNASTAASFISVAPGLHVRIADGIRMVAGVRVMWDLSETLAEPSNITVPFVRFDFTIPYEPAKRKDGL